MCCTFCFCFLHYSYSSCAIFDNSGAALCDFFFFCLSQAIGYRCMGCVALLFIFIFIFGIGFDRSSQPAACMCIRVSLYYYYRRGLSGNKSVDCHSYGFNCVKVNKRRMRFCIKYVQPNPNNN